MNICVIGGGNIGTTLSAYIKHTYPEYQVRLFTNHPERFQEHIQCNDIEQECSYTVTLDLIGSEPSLVAKDAELVFIALPHFAVEKAFRDISPYVRSDALIGVLPGGGGCEFFFEKYFGEDNVLFGFQRVPFTAKLVEYGRETNLKSWKPYSVVGALQRKKIAEVCRKMNACGLKTQAATNYLEIALTPTNPILHTARTHDLFRKYDKTYIFDERFKFYVGWTDEASETLFQMDSELHQLLDAMKEIDTFAIRPLSEHYESPTVKDLTQKINSIRSFQTVYAPLKVVDGGYRADLSSRMFIEDFQWGLMVIRSYFEYFHIPAPTMDKLLKWYADYMGLEWFIENELKGYDLKRTGAIQRYGIHSAQELLNFYQK